MEIIEDHYMFKWKFVSHLYSTHRESFGVLSISVLVKAFVTQLCLAITSLTLETKFLLGRILKQGTPTSICVSGMLDHLDDSISFDDFANPTLTDIFLH